MDTGPSHLSVWFHDICITYDLDQNNTALAEALDAISQKLSQSRDARQELGGGAETWSDLGLLWASFGAAQITVEDDGDQELRASCVSLGKFTRNLVADVATNQNRAFANEPDIRRLLHHFTSWSATQDPNSYPLTQMLTQALSNIVTANESLTSRFWSTYMTLPEDQVVFIRLLASPDRRTILTVSVLILNCIHESHERICLLCTSPIGVRVCVSLLNVMVNLYDAEDDDGVKAFDIGYVIFTRIAEAGLVPVLFKKLSMEDEIITPHQTTLLKLLDSYLLTLRPSVSSSSPNTQNLRSREGLAPMLSESFFSLSTFAQSAIQQALTSVGAANPTSDSRPKSRPTSASHDKRALSEDARASTSSWFEESSESEESEMLDKSPKFSEIQTLSGSDKSTRMSPRRMEFDASLPRVCEALVLITQCIITLTLELPSSAIDMKAHFNHAQNLDGQGLVENLIGLLHLLDRFLPRINLREQASDKVVSIEGDSKPDKEIPGFACLKRDLVRLLGILCNEDRAVQDRIRECGGIPLLMNLCVVDARNPYLREHAIFTLHNVLKGNSENQAVLDTIQPAVSGEG